MRGGIPHHLKPQASSLIPHPSSLKPKNHTMSDQSSKNTLYRQASFLISAAKLNQAPSDSGYEVAFAGRSNAGRFTATYAISTYHH